MLSSPYSNAALQTPSNIFSSPSNILPFLMYLSSALGLFNKSRSLMGLSPQEQSFCKELFNLMREMLVVKGKDAFFSTHIHFDDDLGMMMEKDPRKAEKNEKEAVDETGDVRLKTLIALIAMAEKKGFFFNYLSFLMFCCSCCYCLFLFLLLFRNMCFPSHRES
jgi:hypothetical protein